MRFYGPAFEDDGQLNSYTWGNDYIGARSNALKIESPF